MQMLLSVAPVQGILMPLSNRKFGTLEVGRRDMSWSVQYDVIAPTFAFFIETVLEKSANRLSNRIESRSNTK